MRAFSTVWPLSSCSRHFSTYVDGGAALGFNFTFNLNLNPYFHPSCGDNSSLHHIGTL